MTPDTERYEELCVHVNSQEKQDLAWRTSSEGSRINGQNEMIGARVDSISPPVRIDRLTSRQGSWIIGRCYKLI